MRNVTKLALVLSLGLISAAAACNGGDDTGDAGDSGSDVLLKKDVPTNDVNNDVPVSCTAASSYASVTNQQAQYTPTPTDGGTDAATTDAATTDAADDGSADAGLDDGSADGAVDDGSADAAVADASDDGSTDAGGGPIGGPNDVYQYTGDLNSNPDNLDIEIYAGYGVFQNGVKLGKYTLAGNELDYATCGLCVLVFAGGQDPYMATGGTVELTSVQGTFSGTLTNVTFTHVSIDPNTFESTPLGDGCNTSIPSLSISAPVQ